MRGEYILAGGAARVNSFRRLLTNAQEEDVHAQRESGVNDTHLTGSSVVCFFLIAEHQTD